MFCHHRPLALIGLVAFCCLFPSLRALADLPVHTIQAQGSLTVLEDGFAIALLSGTAPGMGRFVCYGELQIEPSEEASSLAADGVLVFTAANGDVIVAVTQSEVYSDGAYHMMVRWRDSVTLADGTTVTTTGRFLRKRPPGPIYIKVTDRSGF